MLRDFDHSTSTFSTSTTVRPSACRSSRSKKWHLKSNRVPSLTASTNRRIICFYDLKYDKNIVSANILTTTHVNVQFDDGKKKKRGKNNKAEDYGRQTRTSKSKTTAGRRRHHSTYKSKTTAGRRRHHSTTTLTQKRSSSSTSTHRTLCTQR